MYQPMNNIPLISQNSRNYHMNEDIANMTIKEYMKRFPYDVFTSLSEPSIVRAPQFMETPSKRTEETETLDHSGGISIQQLEGINDQIDKYPQFSKSLFSNEIFSEFKQEEDMEMDWSILSKFYHYDSDEEILSLLDCNEEKIVELRNQDGVMTEEELIATMEPVINETSSLHPEVEQLEENDQAMVRIGNETENRICGNQISSNIWIKTQSTVEIQTVVELTQPTIEVSISTNSLFYQYEDPFWHFERKESFSQFLEYYGASQNGHLPAINDKYLRTLLLINLHLNDIYRYYHPCFTLSVGKVTRFLGK